MVIVIAANPYGHASERFSRDPDLPQVPGLYRIRRVEQDDLDYIGETGRSLRERLGALNGIYQHVKPYGAPHTAGPALWALRHATGCEFETSIAPVEGPRPWRKGLEAVAIALYRQNRRQSPTVEFGRILAGYHPWSGNSARLVAAGKRFRDGPAIEAHPKHQPGIGPLDALAGDPQDQHWGGHTWTSWVPLHELAARVVVRGSGLYRIRGSQPDTLLYVGQGRIPNRPRRRFATAQLMRRVVMPGRLQALRNRVGETLEDRPARPLARRIDGVLPADGRFGDASLARIPIALEAHQPVSAWPVLAAWLALAPAPCPRAIDPREREHTSRNNAGQRAKHKSAIIVHPHWRFLLAIYPS